MKKQPIFVITIIIGFLAILTVFIKEYPIVLGSSGALPQYNINDLIKRADIIVIGKVQTNLPSQWISNNTDDNDPQNASWKEVSDARGLFTDSLISIDRTLKGDINTPTVRIRSFTGETKKVQWVNDSEPIYEKHKIYLLFLIKDYGPTAKVNPGDYIAVGAIQGVFEIVDDKAISINEEWQLEELIAYIQKVLSEPTQTPTELIPEQTPLATMTPEIIISETETPIPTETITPTP